MSSPSNCLLAGHDGRYQGRGKHLVCIQASEHVLFTSLSLEQAHGHYICRVAAVSQQHEVMQGTANVHLYL
jgi:hypothetical protein